MFYYNFNNNCYCLSKKKKIPSYSIKNSYPEPRVMPKKRFYIDGFWQGLNFKIFINYFCVT